MPELSLILPVETQVREFDAKLLLACVAAERGLPTYIGFQNQIRNKITQFPPSIFIAKGFASRKAKMMHILQGLGHHIYAWDEEGLVHHPPYVYYDRRMSKESLECLSGLFAWGQDYVDLVEAYPFYDGTPLYLTGNPRIDLLRPALRSFFQPTVDAIHKKFGDFILVNSSFGGANFAVSELSARQKGTAKTVKASAQYWQEQAKFRSRVFAQFRGMVVALAKKFTDTTVVLRPHPAENIESWNSYAADLPNLHIVQDGNVVPWLIAARMMIHNGCMTAVEGALLETPILAYQPETSEDYDRHLPNAVSQPFFTLETLFAEVARISSGGAVECGLDRLHPVLDDFLILDEQELAADRIIGVIEKLGLENEQVMARRDLNFFKAWFAAKARALSKWVRSKRSDDIYSEWHQRQQFPKLTVSDVETQVDRFRSALNRFDGVRVQQIESDIFLVSR